MQWKLPPVIKIYEALGALADQRVQVVDNTAKVYSSSGNKYYEVKYDPETNAIMANDNGSYWQGYLGYPSITFLLATGRITYSNKVAAWLQNIPWKDINTQFKNDFTKTERYIRDVVQKRDGDLATLDKSIQEIMSAIEVIKLNKLPSKLKPPAGY